MNQIITILFCLVILCSCKEKNTIEKGVEDTIRNNKTPTSTPCPPNWIASGKALTQIYINDSTEQMKLNDTLWFEAINKEPFDSLYKCYLKMYRTNGKLESEGFAVYFKHPIEDFKKLGGWTYYDCNGDIIPTTSK